MKFFVGNSIKLNRNELAGAFGDIGTDLPLILAMIMASGLDSASVLIMFGLFQILNAFIYGMPMPAQPLKAFAVIVITQGVSADIVYGGGLAIGIVMFLLVITGIIRIIGKYLPKVVIRGIQLGLGLQLTSMAVKDFILVSSIGGYIIAGIAFLITIFLLGNKKYPPALFIIALGIVYTSFINFGHFEYTTMFEFALPKLNTPGIQNIYLGFLLLAIPQIPLSLGNSIYATHQIAKDFFPEKKLSISKIGMTYSMMNIIAPFFSGLPCCHGSGGMAGHYAFGGRTGGSVMIYGLFFLSVGLFMSHNFELVFGFFPLPVLGVILFFEGFALIRLTKDVAHSIRTYSICLIVGLMAVLLPYGYLFGIITGIILYYKPVGLFKNGSGKND